MLFLRAISPDPCQLMHPFLKSIQVFESRTVVIFVLSIADHTVSLLSCRVILQRRRYRLGTGSLVLDLVQAERLLLLKHEPFGDEGHHQGQVESTHDSGY